MQRLAMARLSASKHDKLEVVAASPSRLPHKSAAFETPHVEQRTARRAVERSRYPRPIRLGVSRAQPRASGRNGTLPPTGSPVADLLRRRDDVLRVRQRRASRLARIRQRHVLLVHAHWRRIEIVERFVRHGRARSPRRRRRRASPPRTVTMPVGLLHAVEPRCTGGRAAAACAGRSPRPRCPPWPGYRLLRAHCLVVSALAPRHQGHARAPRGPRAPWPMGL